MRALALLAALFPAGAAVHTFHHENVLGTSLDLKIESQSPENALRAESAALLEIDRLAAILSAWDPASEFSRWAATSGEAVPVSKDLLEVLSLFDKWRQKSGGALDASAETVIRLWKTAEARGQAPSKAERDAAAARIRQRHWTLDAAAQTAARTSSVPLVLASFTKSYIASHAAEAARRAGAAGVSINIGGDIVVRGEMAETVAVANPADDAENAMPLATLSLRDSAVATSGGYRRGFRISGQRYSHIVDPRTGAPAGHIASATVSAPDGVDAGALATALCILSPSEGQRLAAAVPGAEYLLITAGGKQIASRGWNQIARAVKPAPSEKRQTPRPAMAFGFAPATAAAAWEPGFELQVQLELNRIEGQRYRRPFVAVWIEDKDRFPVRTLALWYDKPRWLPDLRSWSRSDRIRSLAEGSDITTTVSSATRAPGKYTLKWDGKDNTGKLVKPGRYTVHIEAAREHGTYQVMRQEMEFNGTAATAQIAGGTELGGATLDYRKVR